MAYRNDLGTLRGQFWNGRETLDLFSRKADGVLASIIDDRTLSMYTQSVSIIDHITEPRDVDDYYIEELKCQSTPNQWGLFRKYPDSEDALLGCVTTEQGAKNLLEYLKSNAS